MTAIPRSSATPRQGWRPSLKQASAIAGLAGCLAAVGCSAGSPSAAGANGLAASRVQPAAQAGGTSPGARMGALPAAAGDTSAGTPSTVAASQSIVYTATLTVRASHPATAARRAAALAADAGGYVSSETASQPADSNGKATVSMQLKVSVPAYQPALTSLGRLGQVLSQTQHADNVTASVADVASRVTSAQDAISALRALLARAGSVGSLLTVQDQINTEETSLEALQAQQRALDREVAYATISLTLTAPAHHARPAAHRVAGFTSGLGAGWRALRGTVTVILTAVGAVLPFAVPLALLLALAAWLRAWLARRRLSVARPE